MLYCANIALGGVPWGSETVLAISLVVALVGGTATATWAEGGDQPPASDVPTWSPSDLSSETSDPPVIDPGPSATGDFSDEPDSRSLGAALERVPAKKFRQPWLPRT